MDFTDDEFGFLRELVKVTRQRSHVVAWVDRDGTKRQTTLTAPEAARLAGLAQRQRVSPAELLRQVAHIPVAKIGRGEMGGQTRDGVA